MSLKDKLKKLHDSGKDTKINWEKKKKDWTE